MPLVAVELSLNGSFRLSEQDADILVRVTGGSLLWQKERLLNIGIPRLPESCDTVVWLDCDVALDRDDWPAETRRLLADYPLVQPFRRITYMGADGTPDHVFDSVAYRYALGSLLKTVFQTTGMSQRLEYAPGMAWAARREMIQRHGLYDAMVLGTGDKVLFSAACGRLDECADAYHMGAAERRHFDSWAVGFHEEVRGRIGYVDGDARHLWHGDLSGRNYAVQHSRLDVFAFDPPTDLRHGADGAWIWSSDKPDLHAFVRQCVLESRANGHKVS